MWSYQPEEFMTLGPREEQGFKFLIGRERISHVIGSTMYVISLQCLKWKHIINLVCFMFSLYVISFLTVK